MRCFALRKGRCTVLNVKKCGESSCRFFKTEVQFKEDRQKAFKRISSLDEVTQRHIFETYYGGKLEVSK
ncbi:MAG: hypothetical protein K0R09_699 [Clostridiales bacterium]|jgi:hypothetical protein|nr:hypothetical protein [Clostridiales bacterium]